MAHTNQASQALSPGTGSCLQFSLRVCCPARSKQAGPRSCALQQWGTLWQSPTGAFGPCLAAPLTHPQGRRPRAAAGLPRHQSEPRRRQQPRQARPSAAAPEPAGRAAPRPARSAALPRRTKLGAALPRRPPHAAPLHPSHPHPRSSYTSTRASQRRRCSGTRRSASTLRCRGPLRCGPRPSGDAAPPPWGAPAAAAAGRARAAAMPPGSRVPAAALRRAPALGCAGGRIAEAPSGRPCGVESSKPGAKDAPRPAHSTPTPRPGRGPAPQRLSQAGAVPHLHHGPPGHGRGAAGLRGAEPEGAPGARARGGERETPGGRIVF
jgi:hypothetical protein